MKCVALALIIFAVVVINLWMSYPFFTVIILGALQSIPEDTRPKMRKLGQGGALDYVLSIPQAIISQAPYLLDMGLAGIVGSVAGDT